MRRPDDPSGPPGAEATAQVRSAFWRQGPSRCTWPQDFEPTLSSDDPVIQDLAERIWDHARDRLEAGEEGFNHLLFNEAVDQAASDLFAMADVGIKQLSAAKQLLQEAFGAIQGACALQAVPAAPREEGAGFVARLDAQPPIPSTDKPGHARLCLSAGDLALTVDLQVPSQSWLYQGYHRLKWLLERLAPQEAPPATKGVLTDDRELRLGLRYLRFQDQERPEGRSPR